MNIPHVFIAKLSVLKVIVTQMKAYAALHPFDYRKAIKDAQNDDDLKVEPNEDGTCYRVRGAKPFNGTEPYSRYITVDCVSSMCISYIHNLSEEGTIAQFTLVQPGITISEVEKIFFADLFMGDNECVRMKTPPHVFCLCRKLDTESQ